MRSAQTSIENSFVRGLVTEATGLNFPENAAKETWNCVFSETAKVTRRLGFAFEEDYSTISVTRDDSSINSFLWEAPAGQGDLSFVVVQVGRYLYFYESDAEATLSSGIFVDSAGSADPIDLDTFQISTAPSVVTQDCQFSSGSGHLFVTHPYCHPFYISYSVEFGTFTAVFIDIQIRDLDGVEDGAIEGALIESRSTTLSNAHKYNLYNQGWYLNAKNNGPGNPVENVLVAWDNTRTDFPSNADIWYLYKDASDLFDLTNIDRFALGNSPAPKGHYLLNAFFQQRATASGIPLTAALDPVSSGFYRPKACAFFAGRVFYAGVDAQGFNTKIYFSQIIDKDDKIGKCYQESDPTSEHLFDLLPTDGGVIVIPEVGGVIRMIPLEGTLVILAYNGIWTISGSTGIGFAANDYSIQKLAKIPVLSAKNIVIVDGYPLWWNNDGIFTLSPDNVSKQLAVQSLTEKTIRTFYNDIPSQSKLFATGAYNSRTRIVQWLYRSVEASDSDDKHNYDRILNLNLNTGAFYPWSITETDNTINGIVAVAGLGATHEEGFVVDEADATVVDQSDDAITLRTAEPVPLSSTFFYFTSTQDSGTTFNATFSLERDSQYLDFDEDYESYFITGYRLRGDAQRRFQNNYITVYSEREIDSSCLIQGIWNYASSLSSNRWTTQQQIYIDQPYFDVVKRRLKIRGNGVAVQLRFESETSKPFNIIGWSLFDTVNNSP